MFLDPPYELTDAELAANLVALAPRLEPDAIVVVERSSRSAEPDWSGVLELTKRKDYGDTTVWYAQPVELAGS